MLNPLQQFTFTVAATANTCDTKEQKRAAVSEWILEWLTLQASFARKPAVVFDVDATLVDKFEDSHRRIESVYSVYKKCSDLGIACYIVTARPDFKEGRRELRHLLKSMGVKKIARTFMRPRNVGAKPRNISAFKSDCRCAIEKEDCVTILANIGDNWHDLLQYPYEHELKILTKMDSQDAFIVFAPNSKYVSVKLPN